jgi:predicted dinucleotide-binding enzyme
MKTAIIGLGNIGTALAKNLAGGGATFMVADHSLEKAKALKSDLGSTVSAVDVDTAVREADVVILAIPFDGIKEFVVTHRTDLAGKIVVDPSNPIAPDDKGAFKKIIPEAESAGEQIARLLPEGAELVKGFGTLGVQSLISGAGRSPRAVLFFATDYPEAGRAVSALVQKSGFDAVAVGGIDQSIRLEVFGDLHEFGKLGKLVTTEEAKALI